MPRTVVLVEGESDRVALLTLAGLLGLDLAGSGADVVAMGGVTNLGRHLRGLAPGVGAVALHDAGEAPYVARTVRAHPGPAPALFVCDADLEDELIRALGTGGVEAVLAAHGDLGSFRTFQKQPQWQGRPTEAQLRRFFGSSAGKIRYARPLVEALDLGRVPRPLERLLAYVGPT